MSEGIFVDGARHIFAGEAAEFLGVTRGHVARLCRKGKMQARKTKKGWEISGESVQTFVRIKRRHALQPVLSPIQLSPFPVRLRGVVAMLLILTTVSLGGVSLVSPYRAEAATKRSVFSMNIENFWNTVTGIVQPLFQAGSAKPRIIRNAPPAPVPSVIAQAAAAASPTIAQAPKPPAPVKATVTPVTQQTVFIDEPTLTARLRALETRLLAQIPTAVLSEPAPISSAIQEQLDALQRQIALTGRINNLSGVTISSPTFSAPITGLTTDSVSEGSNLYYTDSRADARITASNKVSTTTANTWSALQFFSAAASSTQLSVFDKAYFGGSATSTFDSTGFLTLVNGFNSQASSTIASGLFTAAGGASTTDFTSSGISYFATATSTTANANTGNFGTLNAGTLSLTGLSTFTQASTTRFSIFDKAYFGGSATSTFDSTGFLTLPSGFLAQASSTVASGLFTANGGASTTNFTSSGIGYFATATSTTANANTGNFGTLSAGTLSLTGLASFTQASTTRLSVFDTAYFGGSATSTFDSTGFLTLPSGFFSNASSTITSGLFTMSGGASTTNLTASGTGYFGLGAFTNTSGTTTIATGQGFTIGSSQFVLQQGSGNVGLGTTSPYAKLSISAGSGDTNTMLFAIASSTASATTTLFSVDNIGTAYFAGNVGIGTTTPFRTLSLVAAVSTAQTSFAYDTGNTTEFLTSSTGDFFIYPTGKDILANDSNFWVCSGGSGNTNGCPTGTPSGQGNLIVETRFGVASSTPWAAISVGAGGAVVTTENSLSDGATIAIDWTQGNQQLVTLGGNRTITFSSYIPGQTLRLVVCQDGTGSRTLSWPAAVLWSGGTAPTLTTTANKCDALAFFTTSATGTIRVLGSSVLNF